MAVTLTAATIEEETNVSATAAARLLPVAAALVEQYAPSAPVAVQNEAALRVCGYLSDQPKSARSRETVDGSSQSYRVTATGALLASGGMALLSGWKVRRAGIIR